MNDYEHLVAWQGEREVEWLDGSETNEGPSVLLLILQSAELRLKITL